MTMTTSPRATMLAAIRRFVRGEDGAGTTLAYLMVVPVYLVTFMLILESCFMLLARAGLGYAAFTAARAAIVHGTEVDARTAAQAAAVEAFTPFASSLRKSGAAAAADTQAYVAAFAEEATRRGCKPGNQGYLGRQHADATAHVSVSLRRIGRGKPWEEDVEVTVSYDYPFAMPVVGRLLGALSAGGVFQLRGTAVLGVEHPENPERRLGIAYGKP